MSKRSYLWRQAQACLSRARVTADPLLKELYEDMAVEFARNAARERDLDSFKTSDWESDGDRPHK
jgi:broad specificity phosphatase PhoE